MQEFASGESGPLTAWRSSAPIRPRLVGEFMLSPLFCSLPLLESAFCLIFVLRVRRAVSYAGGTTYVPIGVSLRCTIRTNPPPRANRLTYTSASRLAPWNARLRSSNHCARPSDAGLVGRTLRTGMRSW